MFYINLKATHKVIFVLGWVVLIQQYHLNALDDHMSEFEKGQTVNKFAEETAMELDVEMSMDAELIWEVHHLTSCSRDGPKNAV